MKILLITHAFPPLNATASHRTYSWAKTWSDMGHEVHVLTPEKHAFDGSMNLNYDVEGMNLHVVPYLRAGNGRAATDRQIGTAEVEKWEKLKTYTRKLRCGLGMFADLRMLAYRPLLKKGRAILRGGKHGFIISTYPPEVIHLVASRLSSDFRIPWIADYRDLWFDEMRMFQTYWITTVTSEFLNRRLLKKATIVSTVSEGLSNRIKEVFDRDIVISYNGFIRPQGSMTNSRPWKDNRIHIVYAGRLYPGKRDPRNFLHSVASFRKSNPDFEKRVAIDFYGYDVAYVRSLAKEFGLEGCVTAHGFVPYEESLSIQRNAEVLLFLDWTEDGAEGILTGKLFEYLVSARPVICVGNRKNTEAAEIIRNSRCGVLLTSDKEIQGFLRTLLVSPPKIEADMDRIEFYSRENQAKILMERIAKTIH